MALDGLSSEIKGHDARLELIRYADDFVIFGCELEPLFGVLPVIAAFLGKRGLSLSKEKTELTAIAQGFDFLGCHFRTESGEVKVSPSQKSVERVLSKLKKEMNRLVSDSSPEMAEQFNAVLRGWANYHQYCTEREAFRYIDDTVRRSLIELGISAEVRDSIILAAETPAQPYEGMHPDANPFEAYWGMYFEKWEYDWGYG
jgi:RNA-directed DNA polymerase